jgi:hypothetical protein
MSVLFTETHNSLFIKSKNGYSNECLKIPSNTLYFSIRRCISFTPNANFDEAEVSQFTGARQETEFVAS